MPEVFWWILGGGILMSSLALTGSLTLVLDEATLKRLILPLVALAAGSMLGGALFHMMPSALEEMGNDTAFWVWVMAGFLSFLVLEQFLHWHHCHRTQSEHKQPLGHLVLFADGVHNFVGGLAVAGAFLVDIRVGITAWIAAAFHEVPQELGDFGVLVHAGWSKGKALAFNLASASTFLVGGLIAYGASDEIDVTFLVPFAAGNFIYIAAADLVPEINRHARWQTQLLHFLSFAVGIGLLLLVRLFGNHQH